MLKVMLVDDEPFVIEGLKTLINWEEHGFSICCEAADGEDALELIKQHSPDVVITDIKMPVIDGLELIKTVSGWAYKRPKFIILSCYDEFNYAKIAMQNNVNHYILKPINEDELLSSLIAVHKELKEEIEKERERDLYIKSIANNVIRQLMSGVSDEMVINRGNNLLGTLNYKEIRCLLLEVDYGFESDLEEAEIQAKSITVKRAIEGVISKENELNIYEDEANHYIIVTNQSILSNFNNKIETLAKKIHEVVVERCKLNACVFIGNCVSDIRLISQSYKQAHAAMKHKFYKGDNCIIFFEEIENISLNRNFSMAKSITDLTGAIESNDIKAIESVIAKVFQEFRSKAVEPDIVKVYINNLRLEVIDLISEMEGNVDTFFKQYTFFWYDIGRLTLDSLMNKVEEFCYYSAEYISGLRKKQSQGIIYEIEDFIKNNYTKDLSLKGLAEKFYVNQVYLGQVFKKTFGMYFIDYLHKLRIEEAKKLIRRTDMRLYEIARQIGYNDPDYFVSKFEKLVQMTPKQYKRQFVD